MNNSAAFPASANGVYREVHGAGPDLVLVHGWGMHGGVWQSVLSKLTDDFRVTVVDLPGHGRSSAPAAFTLDQAAQALLDVAPAHALWVGWSLGGMICLQAAVCAPERVHGLALVAATPRFVSDESWPCGVDASVFAQFARDLAADYRATLQRFLALQARGADQEKTLVKRLRRLCLEQEPPSASVLQQGLDILRTADLRSSLPRLRCPALLLMGSRDTLVPSSAAAQIRRYLPRSEVRLFPGAGHAPFLSSPDAFVTELKMFADRLAASRHG